MSRNRISYRIYPEPHSQHSYNEWAKADKYINGFAHSGDRNEAFAIAKKSAKDCRLPFVVQAVPIGGKRANECASWVIER